MTGEGADRHAAWQPSDPARRVRDGRRYTLFYISMVFSLSYGVGKLHLARETFLGLLLRRAVHGDGHADLGHRERPRFGRKPLLVVGCILAILSGFAIAPLLGSGNTMLVALFLTIELFLMGVAFAPMGAFLPELFPTNGILGFPTNASVAPLLANRGGLTWVGGYGRQRQSA